MYNFEYNHVCSFLEFLFIHFPIGFKYNQTNRIGGVIVRVLTSSTVDRGFEPRSGLTNN